MASTKYSPTLARALRPEDVQRGQYIAILHVIDDFLPPCWSVDRGAPPPAPVPMRWLPFDAPVPFRVLDVCLPYVLVQAPTGEASMLDVRRAELARLDRGFARRSVKRLAPGSDKKEGKES